MPKAKNVDLKKHTLNLREGDYEKMGELFKDKGAGRAIRELVSAFVDKHFGQQK